MTARSRPSRWRQALVAALRLVGLCLVLSMFVSTATTSWWAAVATGTIAAFYLWRFIQSLRGFRTSETAAR